MYCGGGAGNVGVVVGGGGPVRYWKSYPGVDLCSAGGKGPVLSADPSSKPSRPSGVLL